MLHRSAALLSLLAASAIAQDAAPGNHEVKASTFRNLVALDGTLLPAKTTPVKIEPKQWKTLALVSLVPHGTEVRQGDTLARFDTEALKDHVEKVTRARESAKLQLERAELELAAARKATPLDLEATRRAAQQARENLDNWNNIWRPLSLEEATQSLNTAEQNLAYAKEELRQLERMYAIDDITEETEEIILKRTRWSVEKAEFSLKQAKETFNDTTKIKIPRTDKERLDASLRADIALERAERDYSAALKLKELELAEKRASFTKEESDFAELKADLELLGNVKAPTAGRVLWGDWTNGDGPTRFAEFDKKYAASPRGCVAAYDTLCTIASGRPSTVSVKLAPDLRASLSLPASLPESKPSGTRYAVLDSAPDAAVALTIQSLANQPDAQGRHTMTLQLATPAADAPGAKTRVVLADTRKDNAIAIPPAFIATSFENGALVQSVLVRGEDGKSTTRRVIKTGLRNTKEVEVTTGLSAGEILAPQP